MPVQHLGNRGSRQSQLLCRRLPRAVGQRSVSAAFVHPFIPLHSPSFPPPSQLSTWAAPWLGLSPGGAGIAIVLALLIAMGPVCDRLLGGALYNPANAFAELAQGRGTWAEHVVRSVSRRGTGSMVGLLSFGSCNACVLSRCRFQPCPAW